MYFSLELGRDHSVSAYPSGDVTWWRSETLEPGRGRRLSDLGAPPDWVRPDLVAAVGRYAAECAGPDPVGAMFGLDRAASETYPPWEDGGASYAALLACVADTVGAVLAMPHLPCRHLGGDLGRARDRASRMLAGLRSLAAATPESIRGERVPGRKGFRPAAPAAAWSFRVGHESSMGDIACTYWASLKGGVEAVRGWHVEPAVWS